ncbi:2,2-dialkylglycine decarboxylase [Magnaporthiopsis poae ATCC 64411]|uniref:2,2-dialkylglycine decarboxylase n=1 Tax=Magnaporthiopsis poae (strain ATCC 64411 / 73-15) TaxID=644358 RepID=A0A0C4DSB9_MAGP6|nr:2,2-dialkylglycine decarboxylase [Magnaporthiopsis poae ATCC 64411]
MVQRDGLVERSARLGERLHGALREMEGRYGCIGDVRGRGLMAGVEIVDGRGTKKPAMELADRLSARMFELGVSANLATMPSFGGAFRIAPPITITEEELELGLSLMEEAFRTTEGTLPVVAA